jgi:hypothetical protein
VSDGKLYMYDGTSYSKSQSKFFSATNVYDGKVRHANATTWYDNYPMEQYYTQLFNTTWTQGYQGDGLALYNGTFWEHDLVVGDPTNFRGLIGFNKSEMNAFIGSGVVTKMRLRLHLKETSTNGKPDVHIGKHVFNSEPGSYDGYEKTYWQDYTPKQFPNQAYGTYWVDINDTQAYFNGSVLGGIALAGHTATAEDMARFTGYTKFTTQLELTVLK